jgi:hypothetical protein
MPMVISAVSIYWFRRKRSKDDTAVEVPTTRMPSFPEALQLHRQPIFQKALEFRPIGKTFLGPRDFGIPNKRTRKVASSMVKVAQTLTPVKDTGTSGLLATFESSLVSVSRII